MTTIVLFGGPSDERHVSVASAQSIVRALGTPLAWFWAPDGPVHDVAIDDLLAHQRAFEVDFQPKRPALWPDLEQALDTLPVDDAVFLLALHGTIGEDGGVQKMMEKRGIAFTGSGSAASAVAFNKARAKEMLRDRLRMAESRIVRGPETVREMLAKYDRVVLKPLAGGSSYGLAFVKRGEDCEIDSNV
ncbi:MAG TPA: D-alanine--D-alanine ligase, partial [Thermoanaerobaculia bacterium]